MSLSQSSLRKILSLEDFERCAQGFLPRPLLEYVAGGVQDNVSRSANRSAFDDWRFVPRVLVDVSQRTHSITLFGQTFAAPFGIAPMGISALIAYQGDLVLARAAERVSVPMVMSGASLIRLEEIAAAAPQSAWFQAYIPGDDAQIEALVARVAKAGFRTLVITVDTATRANRENNVRAGFSTPLRPNLRLAWEGLVRPRWLLGTLARTFVKHGMPHFENQSATRGVPVLSNDAVRQFGMKEHLSWAHIARIRAQWQGKLVLKGILSVDDARQAVDHGIDGIIVSNHGGRQLDSAATPLRALPEIVAAVGKRGNHGSIAVMIDSGFRRGGDILKALCLGADFVFIGRPMLYAAALCGEPGVAHAIQLLSDEVRRDMALLGVTEIAGLNERYLMRA